MEEDEARLVDAEVDHDEKAQGYPAPRMSHPQRYVFMTLILLVCHPTHFAT